MVVVCACDSLADWAAVNGVLALDTSDFQEGTASISNTGIGAVPNTVESEYDPAGTWDWSAEDHLVFWFKTSERSDLKLRVWSGANAGVDYIEWSRQFLQQVPVINGWYRVKLYKDDFDASGGAINWAAVKAIRIQLSQTAEWITYRIDDIWIMSSDPVKAKIGAVAGLDYVSDDILELDIWGDDLKVGRWQMLLKNTDNKYGGRFHTNEASDIEINAVTMMKGYVDDAFPFLDDRGVYTNNLKIMGRDYGRDLARLMYSFAFVDTKGDDLIDAILAAKGSEITYTSPSAAAVVNMERSRTYLIDWLQDVATRTNMNYSAYVDQAKALKFFAVGTENSGVALASIAAALDNNILHLLKGEEIGFSIANSVELSAGSLKDHYSDGNAPDFTEGANTTCVNEGMTTGAVVANAPTATVFKTDLPSAINDFYRGLVIEFTSGALDGERKLISAYVGATKQVTVSAAFSAPPNVTDTFVVEGCTNGISSIKFYCTINSFPIIYLDFSGAGLYSHAGLDLSPPDEMSFNIRHNHPGVATLSVRPRLEDAAGNVIEFKRGGGLKGLIGVAQKGKTDVQLPDKWYKIQIPVGESEDNVIQAAEKENKWYYTTTIDEFDWTNVVKIYFKAATATFGAARIWMDNLIIPTVEVISIVEDAVSIAAYDRSEWFDQRNDIRNQIELSYAAASELEKRKDPLKNIKIIATGQTGIKYPGQTVTVQAPQHGLAGATTYRIVSYHHQIRKNPIRGAHSFITTLDLVSDDLSPATQFIDPRRYMLNRDPVGAALEILALTRRRVRTSTTTQRKEFGDTHPVSKVFHSGSGMTFPVDPEDGFIFKLTADIVGPPVYYGDEGIDYQYDVGTGTWIREPTLLHRAAQPLAGGEVTGDYWRDTTNNVLKEWSGAAWIQIASLDMADAPDFGTIEWPTDQLAIETRPWTGNFSIIWDDKDDEPPTDWNHFKWGLRDQENAADATISYSSGLPATVDINFGQNINLGDGEWFAYWDEAFKTGGDYDVKWTQNYATASGVGKGLLAVVQVRNAASESPSVMLYNTYIPQMGVGSLVAHSIYSKHISADFITGKNFRTGAGVQWAAGGNPGVILTGTGLRGKGAAGAIMVEILAANGYITAAGGAVRLDDDGINLIDDVATQYLIFRKVDESIKGAIYKDVNDYIVIHSTDARIRMRGHTIPLTDGGFDLGLSAALRWGKLWTEDGDFETQLTIPRYNGADPVAPVNGDFWLRTDL